MSIMNYNEWFHKYHAYLKGTRKNVTSYNDTKWNTISERYDTLIDLMSGLLDDQPFNVVGNYTGFQQLTELMERSNYAYDDIDHSLANTYRTTLQNAMSRMLVNTHCVIANYRFDDKRHVSHDKYGHYYIVDVPFDQLHFGERDEFVRQKLHAFYETESTYFMPSDRFLSNEISKILGFTVICCTNGFMSDDWSVGISEQGFRFKIGWKYSSDVTFTIYKLDESSVMDIVIPINKMKRTILIVAIALMSMMSMAQSIVGDWMTVDDKTGQNFSVVRIYQGPDGLYYGKVAKILMGPQDVVCVKCEDEDKDKPIQDLVIIRGMHMEKGELRGGKVLDPNNGKFYYGKIYLKGGNLVLRGSLDKAGLFGRNQTWVPAQ